MVAKNEVVYDEIPQEMFNIYLILWNQRKEILFLKMEIKLRYKTCLSALETCKRK